MTCIALRADASVPIGSGHVKRCLSLAQAARACGLVPLFLCRPLDGTAAALLAHAGVEVLWLPAIADTVEADAKACAELLQGRAVTWALADHYGLDARWHDRVRARLGCRTAAIDDLADRPLTVDLLIDSNDEDAQQTYAAVLPRTAKVLGGPAYALLDPAYAAAPRYAFHDPVRSIGIFMGGTDPTGACLDALAACEQAGFHGPVEVVCSPLAPRFGALVEACAQRPQTRLTQQLPRLDGFYAGHDLLIGAGGTASWERCCIGTPTIACQTADNQRATLPRLSKRGALHWAHDTGAGLQVALAQAVAALLADAPARKQLGRAAQGLVDGLGSARVAVVLASAAGVPLRPRPATTADEALLLHWANDPAVRAQAFHSDAIAADEHSRWLCARIGNPERRLLVLEAANGVPVGQVRLERTGHAWEIGYLLAPPFRGLGLGAAILRAAFAACPEAVPLAARVKPGNKASLRIFRGLGFREQQVSDDRGPHLLFTLEDVAG
ncbi:MAG: UDP-2,4-diacetamido-2,4,6-trideoxy-beta-L-altropyranose hydrolase [Ramlibacter sp.]|nr:UDP-2,4-diacetamido-2,4,6-trideoxy-beta-L-altropyranose hydrolase [Ramlibacter sp.]